MDQFNIIQAAIELNLNNYSLNGSSVTHQQRKLKDLSKIFQDRSAFGDMDTEQIVYTVQSWLPVSEGTPGGLFFGTTNLVNGKVGDEYFMTKGHYHLVSDRAEFYWCVHGEGMLILMDLNRQTWAELMVPGSLHYIPPHVAHRVANTGDSVLTFGACWPSDAGHNYEEIAKNGFSASLVERNGKPELVSCQ